MNVTQKMYPSLWILNKAIFNTELKLSQINYNKSIIISLLKFLLINFLSKNI
jgi:hypothetical protein